MATNYSLVITLPKELENIPVQIVKGSVQEVINAQLCRPEHSPAPSCEHSGINKYAFVLHKGNYVKILLDEILWIKSDRGYSTFRLRSGEEYCISSNLSVVGRKLPGSKFIRIHKSYIVNFHQIEAIAGSDVISGGERLPIGRKYRESLLKKCVFISVRQNEQ